uniref:Uncharacterized protein n=1 Tax=Knipowitschia caucasica TaxID=637954 RepID=A0AAV2J1V1_KNICA
MCGGLGTWSVSGVHSSGISPTDCSTSRGHKMESTPTACEEFLNQRPSLYRGTAQMMEVPHSSLGHEVFC